MTTRLLLIALLSTFYLAACDDEPDPADTVDIGTLPDSLEVDTEVAADTAETSDADTSASNDAEDADDTEDVDAASDVEDAGDAEVVCPEDRAPRVVDGVVVDPCGCCALTGEYCHGHSVGGSPVNGMCPVVYDDAPPCTTGVDANGCPTQGCSGSCLVEPDTGSGEPDAG